MAARHRALALVLLVSLLTVGCGVAEPTATRVPPTVVPPTTVPPTAVLPTAVPPTAIPPTAVPPTIAPTPATADSQIIKAETVHTVRAHSDMVIDVAFTAHGEFLASSGRDRSIKLWDVKSGQEVHSCAAPMKLDTFGAVFSEH